MANRLHISGGTSSGGGGGSGTVTTTGSPAATNVAYFSGATSITGTTLFDYVAPVSGSATTLTVAHGTDAASSSATLIARVAGTSAGDAALLLDVTGGTGWYLGNDNSASDALIAGTGSAVGTNPRLRLLTDGTASFWGPLITYNTGGTAAQLTEIYAGAAGGNDGGVVIYGGNGSGAYAAIYGPTHATLAGLINFSGSARLTSGGDFFVGSSVGPFSYGVERVGARLIPVAGNAALSHATLQAQYLNSNGTTAFTSTQVGVGSDWRRTVTTSLTDTGSIYAITAGMLFTITAGQSYTNAQTSAVVSIAAPISATGTLALTNYSGINIAASAVATGTRKTGILIGLQQGASNNTAISDSAAYTGDWGLYFSNATNPHYLESPVRIGTTTTATFSAEKVTISKSTGGDGSSHVGLSVLKTYTGNVAFSTASLGAAAASFVTNRTITSSTTDTLVRTCAIFAQLTFTISGGQTFTNTATQGMSVIAVPGFASPSGAMAVTHYHGIYVGANSFNTGGTKYGIRVGAQTSATTANFCWHSDTGVASYNDYIELRQNADPGAVSTDTVRFGAQDTGAAARTFSFRTEAAVAAGALSGTHSVPIYWNGTQYNLLLNT